MAQPDSLRAILADLGLSMYHHSLTAEGFDDWSTICDIKEADLSVLFALIAKLADTSYFSDALGFKLGHRRVSDSTRHVVTEGNKVSKQKLTVGIEIATSDRGIDW